MLRLTKRAERNGLLVNAPIFEIELHRLQGFIFHLIFDVICQIAEKVDAGEALQFGDVHHIVG